MDNFTFYAPTYFDFGKGSVAHVADLMRLQRFLQRHPFLMWNWAE